MVGDLFLLLNEYLEHLNCYKCGVLLSHPSQRREGWSTPALHSGK